MQDPSCFEEVILNAVGNLDQGHFSKPYERNMALVVMRLKLSLQITSCFHLTKNNAEVAENY